VRQPAALCGVTGFKPTYGRVSRYGLIAFGSSLDAVGVLAPSASEVEDVLAVISGSDARDSTCADRAPFEPQRARDDLRGLRIGVPREYFPPELQGELRAVLERALHALRGLGAELIDVALPHTRHAVATYYVVGTAEASSNLARYDGIRYGHRAADVRSLEELYTRTRGEGFGTEPKRRIMLGAYVLRAGFYEAYYGKALRARRKLADDFSAAFADCDAIVTPTSPVPAFKFGERTADPLQMYLADVLTVAPNLAGIPAISQPCGLTRSGLPIGLQIIGPALGEEICFRVGGAYEARTDWHTRLPPEGG
jgi:aspartyl-tRNA(Asn)/glutamyl-tRNA(Gln) amidotransferase subunit A